MKLSSIVLSAILFATVQQSNASNIEPKVTIHYEDLLLPVSVNEECKKTYSNFTFLESSDLDFYTSETTYETRPLWPLICAMSEASDKTVITKESYGYRITYTVGGSNNQYDFIETEDNAFEVGAFNENLMNNFSSQKALLAVMTAMHNDLMDK